MVRMLPSHSGGIEGDFVEMPIYWVAVWFVARVHITVADVLRQQGVGVGVSV